MQFIGPSAVSFPPWISSQAFPSQSPLHCRKPFLNLLQLWPHNPSIHHHPPPKRKVKGPKILCEFLLHKLLQWSRSHGSGPIGTNRAFTGQISAAELYQIRNNCTFFFFNMKEYIHILKICSVCIYLLRQHTPQNHAFIPSS